MPKSSIPRDVRTTRSAYRLIRTMTTCRPYRTSVFFRIFLLRMSNRPNSPGVDDAGSLGGVTRQIAPKLLVIYQKQAYRCATDSLLLVYKLQFAVEIIRQGLDVR